MPYYWRTMKSPAAIKPGWKVPPYRPNGKPQQVTEAIFEEVRKKHYSSKPSRLGAVFVCPDLKSEFCSDPGAKVFEVDVQGKVFATHADYFSSAVGYGVDLAYGVAQDPEKARSEIEEYAHLYWKGGYSNPDEAVVQGRVTIVGEAPMRRAALHPIWKTISNTIKPMAWIEDLKKATGLNWQAQPIKAGVNLVYLTMNSKPYSMTLLVEVPESGALLAHMVLNWDLPTGKGRLAFYAPIVAAESPARLLKNTRNQDLKILFTPIANVRAWQAEGEEGLHQASEGETMLRRDMIRLAYTNPDLRPHLLPLLKEALEEEEGGKGGPKKGPSAIMKLFLHTKGDDMVSNPKCPDCRQQKIKIKSLPNTNDKGKQMFNEMLEDFQDDYELRKKKEEIKEKKQKRKEPSSVKTRGENVEGEKIKRRKAPTKKELEFGGIGEFKLPGKKAKAVLDQIEQRIAAFEATLQGMIQ